MKPNDKLELLGLVLIVAFFAVWWWPSALLVAGVLLVTLATVRERAAKPDDTDEREAAP